MRDLPILFSAPMVRALLAGTKTQTRRIINLKPDFPIVDFVKVGTDKETGRSIYEMKDRYGQFVTIPAGKNFRSHHYSPPIAVGDRLYVREHWRVSRKHDATAPRDLPIRNMTIFCEAGGSIANQDHVGNWRPSEWPSIEEGIPEWAGKRRQAMHMPRWASRITLLVDDVRVERLQSISEEDALAEGVPDDNSYAGSFEKIYCRRCDGSSVHGSFGAGYGVTEVDCAECETAAMRYRNLWDHINGDGAWAANPWVVAYSFKTVLENIEHIGRAA